MRGWPRHIPLHEFLLVGFAPDVPDIEKDLLPSVRELGARTAVVVDAGHALAEYPAARPAGRDFLHSAAYYAGGFRVRAALFLGPDTIRLAVGPGDPGTTGDGLWTVVHCEGGASHAVVADFADWLDALPGRVRLAPWVAEHLAELALALTERHIEAPETTGPEARLLHTLDDTLIGHLPSGPVDELRVRTGAFDADAVGAVVGRLAPRQVAVVARPGAASFDVGALAGVFGAAPARIAVDEQAGADTVVTWRTGTRWSTLTGLPGLAPLGPQAGAAGCVLGVLSEGDTAVVDLPAAPAAAAAPVAPGVVVLGARSEGETLRVAVAGALDGHVTVAASPDGSAGTWRVVGAIPSGQTDHAFRWDGGPGTLLRATCARPDGTIDESDVVYVYGAEGSGGGGAAVAAAPAPVAAPVAAPAPVAAAEPVVAPVAPVVAAPPAAVPAAAVAASAAAPSSAAGVAGSGSSGFGSGYTYEDDEPEREIPDVDEKFVPAAEEFLDAGWGVGYEDGLWEISGSFTNPVPIAARVADRLGQADDATVLVRAQGKGKWVFVAWRAPHLVLLIQDQQIWRTYTFTPPGSPGAGFASGDLASLPSVKSPRPKGPPAALTTLLEDGGIDYPELIGRLFG